MEHRSLSALLEKLIKISAKVVRQERCVRCARVTLPERKKIIGRAFDRQIDSTKRGDRYADCRIKTGFAFDRHSCYATNDREWSSGESRLRWLRRDYNL